MNANEYSLLISKRIKNAMEARNITQSDLKNRCKDFGLDLSQSSLSRMLSGVDKMDVYRVATICKALNLQLNELLSFGPEETVSLRVDNADSAFTYDASDRRFKSYMGDYYGYFYSTENTETIHEGVFKFFADPSTGNCCVSFTFETGKLDVNGNIIRKEYIGTAKLSDNFGAICCEMTSKDENGDVSYIIFKYHFIANQQCECIIGMVVTICAGLKRLPVSHKLLICRQKLSEADMPFIAGQLKLNDDMIIISESDYYDFIKDPLLPESFKTYVEKDKDLFIKKAATLVFYSFREDDVLDNKSLSKEDKVRVINLLRLYSNSKRCKKVGPKGENYVFGYLMEKKKKSEIGEV